MFLTSFLNDCSLHSEPCNCLQKVHRMSSASSLRGLFSHVLSAHGRVYWMFLSGTAWAALLIMFTHFSQRKETACLGMLSVMNICKGSCKHNPWESSHLFILLKLCMLQCVPASFLHALTKTYQKASSSTCRCFFLHEKGITLSRVAIWTRGLHLDQRAASGPKEEIKIPWLMWIDPSSGSCVWKQIKHLLTHIFTGAHYRVLWKKCIPQHDCLSCCCAGSACVASCVFETRFSTHAPRAILWSSKGTLRMVPGRELQVCSWSHLSTVSHDGSLPHVASPQVMQHPPAWDLLSHCLQIICGLRSPVFLPLPSPPWELGQHWDNLYPFFFCKSSSVLLHREKTAQLKWLKSNQDQSNFCIF